MQPAATAGAGQSSARRRRRRPGGAQSTRRPASRRAGKARGTRTPSRTVGSVVGAADAQDVDSLLRQIAEMQIQNQKLQNEKQEALAREEKERVAKLKALCKYCITLSDLGVERVRLPDREQLNSWQPVTHD